MTEVETETVEDLILTKLAEFERRLQDIEDDRLGHYAPTDPEEQRRFWVMETYSANDLDIDINLDQIHKATEWLKTGKLPRKRKPLVEEEEGKVLYLVKE